jgi:hypothetical protein
VKETDAIKTSLASTRKRRIIVVLVFVTVALSLVTWRLYSTRSHAAKTITSEHHTQGILPQLSTGDVANKHGHFNEKTSSSSARSSRSVAKPVEEESFLASIFKDLKDSTPEVCGMSATEAKAFIASNGMFYTEVTNRALAKATSKLVQSNHVREKATGLYLLALQASWDAGESERLNYPGCKGDDDCAAKPYQARQRAVPVNAEPLVELALDSGDIGVYVTALYACSGSNVGACAKISYARWAQIEPDNAAAWMMAASETEARKDSAARASALQRAISASDYKTRAPTLADVLALDEIQAQPPTLLASTLSMIVGINAAYGIGSVGGIGRHCGRLENTDESRRATCDALATKMAEKDETLVGAMMAKSIGERSGWSAERLQPLKDEYEVYTGQIFEGISEENMFSCDVISRGNQQLLRSFALGERGATREFVKNSGKTLAELATSYRARSTPPTK